MKLLEIYNTKTARWVDLTDLIQPGSYKVIVNRITHGGGRSPISGHGISGFLTEKRTVMATIRPLPSDQLALVVSLVRTATIRANYRDLADGWCEDVSMMPGNTQASVAVIRQETPRWQGCTITLEEV